MAFSCIPCHFNLCLPLSVMIRKKKIVNILKKNTLSVHTHTHTHNRFTALLESVRDYLGEQVPER